MTEDQQRVSKNIRLLLFMVMAVSIGTGGYMALLNLYLKELGFGEAFIGRIAGLGSMGTVLTTIPIAWLCGRLRAKWILIGSVFLNMFGDVLLVLSRDAWSLQFGALIAGAGISAWVVATAPFIMRNAAALVRAKIFSYKHGLGMVGAATAAITFGRGVEFLATTELSLARAYQIGLLCATAVKLLAILAGMRLQAQDPLPEEKRTVREFVSARDWRRMLRLTAPNFLIGLGAGLTMPFMNLYFRNRFHFGPYEIGIAFGFCQVFMALGTFLGPKMALRRGNISTVILTQVTSLPFMLILAFTGHVGFALAAFFLRATLMNMGHPLFHHFAMELVEPKEQAVTNAAINFVWNVAWVISSWIGGMSIEAHGFTPTILATGAFYAAATILQAILFRQRHFRRIGLKAAA